MSQKDSPKREDGPSRAMLSSCMRMLQGEEEQKVGVLLLAKSHDGGSR